MKLRKLIQNKLSFYFTKLKGDLSKPETRCLREMVVGILKNRTVLVNKIASGIKDDLSLSQTTKRFRNHYNKEDYEQKVHAAHLQSVSHKVKSIGYMAVDGSDILKTYAKYMEGLDYVHDGDKGGIGLGYWLMNTIYVDDYTIIPLHNKLYSFDCGARSENLEVMESRTFIEEHINTELTWLYDRGMDILRDYIIPASGSFVLRLKKTTQLIYKGKAIKVAQLSKQIELTEKLTAVMAGRSKPKMVNYKGGALKVQYEVNDQLYDLFLVSMKKESGGYCWLLTNLEESNASQLIQATFKAYGHRWKIEEYHRHIKNQYNLEDIQVKTFDGLQSMLAILVVAMNFIYNEFGSLHIKLILESGVKTMNKGIVRELTNFIYYKVSAIVSNLIADMKPRALLPLMKIPDKPTQLNLNFN